MIQFHVLDRSSLAMTVVLGTCTFCTSSGIAALTSDDFNRCTLNAGVWTVADPLGGSTVSTQGVGTSDARLVISVPSGASRDPWIDTNHAVRVMQPATHTDFEIQAKFDSTVSQGYQMQGLMVEQNASQFLRFDINSTGSGAFLYCATFMPGAVTERLTKSIANSTPIWLGLKRTGSQWTARYSTNGTTWTDAITFSYSISVAKVGVYAGNYSDQTAPAFTAKVDYFLNVAAPFVGGEDGTPSDPPSVLTRSVTGSGTISVNPDRPAYYCGPTVTVTAVPASGWKLQNWTGDLSGTNPQQTLAMNVSRTIGAIFAQSAQTPTITNITTSPASTSATVAWNTDQSCSSRLDYGKTTSYELGAATDAAYLTSHTMQLTGLTSQTTYHCRITATTAGGQTSQSADLSFTTLAAAGTLASDDFNACTLNTSLWTVVDPVHGSTVQTVGAGSGEAFLQISIPAGANHDMWTDGLNGVRAMQNAPDADLECTAKFISLSSKAYQMQGLWIEQDATSGIRYDTFYDGSTLSLYSATFVNNAVTERQIQSIANAAPLWLTMRRVGSQWTLRYSFNGTTWVNHASFSHGMRVTKIGPWGGTFAMPGKSPPAFTMQTDYFANSAAILPNEDAGSLPTTRLTRNVIGSGSISAIPNQSTFACGEAVTLTAIPSGGYTFKSWSGDVTGTANPVALQMTADRSVTATFISGGTSISLIDANLSTRTTRDGALLSIGYRISASATESVELECTTTGPYGETLHDFDNEPAVNVIAGDRWYYRDFRINLPYGASLGNYNVYWAARRSNNSVLTRDANAYLNIQSTIAIRVPILMYHYFGPVAYDQEYWVYTDEFRAQMLALKAYGYTTMFFQELMDCRAGIAALPAKPILITIDDGMQNQYTEVLPILSDPDVNMKATSFVVAGDVGYVDPPYSSLTWGQIQEMDASGHMDIQSHTMTHPFMSQLTYEQALQELVDSRATLESRLNKEVRFVCWPYGDYNTMAKHEAYDAGYYGGIAVDNRIETNCNDKWSLRRVWIRAATSVDYNYGDPSSFFMTAIGDTSIVIPSIWLNSVAVLNPSTNLPLDTSHIRRGDSIKIRINATNNGPSAAVAASVAIDGDMQPSNGVLLDTHAAGQDAYLTFSNGSRTIDWVLQVPTTAPLRQYYIQVSFHDQPYVLGWYYSAWLTAFTVTN